MVVPRRGEETSSSEEYNAIESDEGAEQTGSHSKQGSGEGLGLSGDEDVDEDGESIESLGSEGMAVNRSRRRHVRRMRAKDIDLSEDEFWDQQREWDVDDEDEEDWSAEDTDRWKDIIDDDFDVSESESIDELLKAGEAADREASRAERGVRHRRKMELDHQKKLLEVLVNSLNVKAPTTPTATVIQTKLLVASDFNMPDSYSTGRYAEMRWEDVLRSAEEARAKDAGTVPYGSPPPSPPKKGRKKKIPVEAFSQKALLAGYELQIEQTKAEQKKRQDAAFFKEYTKGKEKNTGHNEHTALRNGPAEMFISWDGTRTIEYEETQRSNQGLPSWKDQADGLPFERQMSFFLDIPSETKGLFHPYVPPVLKQDKPEYPKTPICVITGEDAKYLDPKTGYPYRDVAAFKEIQQRYHDIPP